MSTSIPTAIINNTYVIQCIQKMTDVVLSFNEIVCQCPTKKCDSVLDELMHCLSNEDNLRWEQYISEFNAISAPNRTCIINTIELLESFIKYNNDNEPKCSVCGINMGYSNPRQYCGKYKCLYADELSDVDSE
jgi:hypothetical protein